MADEKLLGAINEVYEKEHKKFLMRIRIAVIVLLLAIFGAWLGNGLYLHSKTEQRMQAMIGRAHTVAMLTAQWQERGRELESGTYQVKEKTTPFGENLVYYFSERKGDWFGLSFDEDGVLQYVLYSRKEIPEEYLDTPPDFDKQYKLLGSLFGFQRKKAIAVWAPEEPTGAEDAIEAEETTGTEEASGTEET